MSDQKLWWIAKTRIVSVTSERYNKKAGDSINVIMNIDTTLSKRVLSPQKWPSVIRCKLNDSMMHFFDLNS